MKETKKINIAGIMKEPGSLQNKKGSWKNFKPIVLPEKCTACGICVKFCPDGVIQIKNISGKKIAVVDYDYCPGCMICFKECPFEAIKKEEEKK